MKDVEPPGPRDRGRDGGRIGLVHLVVVAAVVAAVLAGFAVAVPYATRLATLARGTIAALAGPAAPAAPSASGPARASTRRGPSTPSRRRHPQAGPRHSTPSRTTGPGAAANSTTLTNPITAAVRADAAGIVRVAGVAPACSLEQEGSGFVVSLDHVLTNAHVVHGLRSPRVQVGGAGYRYPAHVVFYDPGIDLAVLDVPGLPARPLPVSTLPLPAGTPAVAAGFPLDGPFTLSTGVIQGQALDAGPPVGATTPHDRPVYQLSLVVRPGNSGGPLLTPDGRVAGIVFARGSSRTPIGFAITLGAALDDAGPSLAATRPVSTGRCG